MTPGMTVCARGRTSSSSTSAILFLLLSLAADHPSTQPAGAPPDQLLDSRGVRLRFVEQGSCPPIVLMHGYSGSLDRHFLANGVFSNLAQDHRVIAFDLRGHGKSDKPHDP